MKIFMFSLAFLLALVPFSKAEELILSKNAHISLVTVSTGPEVWQIFGHTAIWIQDESLEINRTYNYGTFEMEAPIPFLKKFATGTLPYYMSAQSWAAFVDEYIYENRSIWVQELALDSVQKQKIVNVLLQNYRPENRAYRYNFFYDNCASRVRDVFTNNLSAQLSYTKLNAERAEHHSSFRQLLKPYLKPFGWFDFGIDLLLGIPADREAKDLNYMFLPELLMKGFDHIEINRGGQFIPLVEKSYTVFEKRNEPIPSSHQQPLILFSCLFILSLFLSFRQLRTFRLQRAFDFLIFSVAGFCGLVMSFMWLGTEHGVCAWNMNILWALPLHLPAAFALWKVKMSPWLRRYFLFYSLLCLLLILGFFFWPQQFHLAILPILLTLALRSFMLYKRKTKESSRLSA